MTERDWSALREAALAGDDVALRLLVDLLTPVVRRRVALLLARSSRRRSTEAEDLVQEILMSMFADNARLLRTWDPQRGASLPHFIGLVAQRRAISLLRNNSGALPLSDDLHEIDGELHDSFEPSSSGAVQEAQAATREELTLLLARLQASLSPLGLELFYRICVHDEPTEQICAATGLSRNAVYIWHTRIIKLAHQARAELSRGDRNAPSSASPVAVRL